MLEKKTMPKPKFFVAEANYQNRDQGTQQQGPDKDESAAKLEMMGRSLYDMVLSIPKTYLAQGEKDIFCLSRYNKGTKTLYQFGKKPEQINVKRPEDYTEEENQAIRKKVQSMEDLGVALFVGGFLLGDKGIASPENILFSSTLKEKKRGAQLIVANAFEARIATNSKIQGEEKTQEQEAFTDSLKDINQAREQLGPYFAFLSNMLSREQIERGLAAIKAFYTNGGAALEANIKSMLSLMPYSEDERTELKNGLLRLIKARCELVLKQFDHENIKPLELRPFKQKAFYRPIQDFIPMEEKLGTQRKQIMYKACSINQQIRCLQAASSNIENLIINLLQKHETLATYVARYKALKDSLSAAELRLQESSEMTVKKRVDDQVDKTCQNVLKEFNEITDIVINELKGWTVWVKSWFTFGSTSTADLILEIEKFKEHFNNLFEDYKTDYVDAYKGLQTYIEIVEKASEKKDPTSENTKIETNEPMEIEIETKVQFMLEDESTMEVKKSEYETETKHEEMDDLEAAVRTSFSGMAIGAVVEDVFNQKPKVESQARWVETEAGRHKLKSKLKGTPLYEEQKGKPATNLQPSSFLFAPSKRQREQVPTVPQNQAQLGGQDRDQRRKGHKRRKT